MELEITKSESVGELISALAKAQGDMPTAIKSKKNPFFKSTYADLASVMDACRKPLSANGLAVLQTIEGSHDNMFLMTFLGHSSGQWIQSKTPLIISKKDVQGMGASITYVKRYCLMAITGVVAEDEDDDGNAAVGNKVDTAQPVDMSQKEVDKYLKSWGDKKDHFFTFMTEIMKQRKWNYTQVIEAFTKDEDYTKATFEAWVEKKQSKVA